MLSAGLFVEDEAHETIVGDLLRRVAAECGATLRLSLRSGHGGEGQERTDLRRYADKAARDGFPPDDGIVVVLDGNCHGYADRKRVITECLGTLEVDLVAAIPDPHVERWLLLDPAAFRQVVGRGFSAPRYKCERDRYKRALQQGIRDAGLRPVLGGLEHAESIIAGMDLQRARWPDKSFGRFLSDARAFLRRHGH